MMVTFMVTYLAMVSAKVKVKIGAQSALGIVTLMVKSSDS